MYLPFSIAISTKLDENHSYLSLNLPHVIHDGRIQGYDGDWEFRWNTFFLTRPNSAAIDGYMAMLCKPNPNQDIYQPILIMYQVGIVERETCACTRAAPNY